MRENRRKEKTKIAYLWRNKMHFGGQNVLVTGIDSRAETHRGRPLFFRHIQNHIPIFFNILKIISQYIQNQIPIYSKLYLNILSSKTIRECFKSREGASLNFFSLYPQILHGGTEVNNKIAEKFTQIQFDLRYRGAPKLGWHSDFSLDIEFSGASK